MEGFSRTRTVLKLVFDDPEYDGLVVKIRRGSVREHLDWDAASARGDGNAQIELMAQLITEWNVVGDDGEPLLITVDSLWSLERATLQAITDAWIGNVREVPAPLGQPSTGGDSLEVASIPTETLSPSLAS